MGSTNRRNFREAVGRVAEVLRSKRSRSYTIGSKSLGLRDSESVMGSRPEGPKVEELSLQRARLRD